MFVSEREVVATLWIEVCQEVRCRRYSASQLTDIFEAVSRSPSLPEDVPTTIIYFRYLLCVCLAIVEFNDTCINS